MNHTYPVYTIEAECQDCYKCVRHCPVKAIRVRDGHAAVLPERCVACGTCGEVCPVKAKQVRNDPGRLKRLLLTEKGAQAQQQMGSVIADVEAQLVAGISEEELAVFHEVLRKIGKNAEA